MTEYSFVIVRTGGGRRFAERIANSIRWLNQNRHSDYYFNTRVVSVGELGRMSSMIRTFNPRKTIIHARAAYPDPNGWMRHLINLEQNGFTVINNTTTLLLTSDKLECAQRLQDHFPHPRTWAYDKTWSNELKSQVMDSIDFDGDHRTLIAKPVTSIEQGAKVTKFSNQFFVHQFDHVMNRMNFNPIIIQEFVPYTAIYRVIVIGGRALPYSFVDRPTEDRWKVSVCLNRTSMEFVANPDPQLLELGENIQRFIGGEINFIDIFETTPNNYVISEINTACNLRIHELLAREAGHPRWNIHFNIARYLVNRALEGD